jgi:hypothetical protein
MDYPTLFAAIKVYMENDFPNTTFQDPTQLTTIVITSTQQINTFIRQAEQRVFNSIQLLDIRKNVMGAVLSGNPYLTVPCDWLASFSMASIDPVTGIFSYMLNKDVSFIREAFPNPAKLGQPTHYAFFDKDSFLLAPTPDQDYNVELHYFYYPISIVDNGTSWLGDHYDSILLYGALLEALAFLRAEQDTVTYYQKRYDETWASLKQLGEGKNRQDNYRVAQTRYPVR